tara:strand:+ start:555 stop:992 length:438 start_codon:yes stop_codon:yes gene_type:complete
MKIVIGSDHAGFHLKKHFMKHQSLLTNKKDTVFDDVGCYSEDSVHYPDIAKIVAEKIANEDAEYGILICGTGIGMSIAANRVSGIRAALCHSPFTADMSRQHNNANILCLGARVLQLDEAINITQVFFRSEFLGGRHDVRLKIIN